MTKQKRLEQSSLFQITHRSKEIFYESFLRDD
jgi:hypothetical protein